MTYGEKAKDNFLNGYTCAQAVLAAFQNEKWFKESDLTPETAMKLASSFGGGMGRLREVCGTVSGMFMAFGLAHGFSAPPESQDAKTEHYKCIQELAARFREANGSIICKERQNTTKNAPAPTFANAPPTSSQNICLKKHNLSIITLKICLSSLKTQISVLKFFISCTSETRTIIGRF